MDTVPFTDPIFAKLNSVVGDINSSNRLLQNVLTTIESELRLRMDNQYWDGEPSTNIEYSEEYEYNEADHCMLMCSLRTCADDLLRPQLSGYKILNTPAEDDS